MGGKRDRKEKGGRARRRKGAEDGKAAAKRPTVASMKEEVEALRREVEGYAKRLGSVESADYLTGIAADGRYARRDDISALRTQLQRDGDRYKDERPRHYLYYILQGLKTPGYLRDMREALGLRTWRWFGWFRRA